MRFYLTRHALDRMAERGIDGGQVEHVLENPVLSEPTPQGSIKMEGTIRGRGTLKVRVAATDGPSATSVPGSRLSRSRDRRIDSMEGLREVNDQVLVEVDDTAETAYVRLSTARVARTVAHNDEINIDLDQFGVVVGIEVLRLHAEIPFSTLVSQYHVDSRRVELLRLLQPTIPSFAATSMTSASLRPSAQAQLT